MSAKRNLVSLLISIALASGTFHAATASADTGSTGYNLGEVESGTKDASALRQSSGAVVYATGNLVVPETDFSGKGEMALFLTRTFNNYWGGVGIFGAKWQSNFDYKLSFNTSKPTSTCGYPRPGLVCGTPLGGTSSLTIWAHMPDGRRIQYVWSATQNRWNEAKASPISYIVRNTDGSYTLHNDQQGVENYSATGYVTSIIDAQNVGWTFAYDGSNYLQSVTHTNGRKVTFTWTGNQLTKVTGPGGNVHTYEYTANALGAGLNLLNKTNGTAGNGAATFTTYAYLDSNNPGSLTGISHNDESFANYSYDTSGYATTTTLGVDGTHTAFSFVYTPGANNTLSVLETSPTGRQTTYAFSNGLVTSTSGTGGDNTPNASKTHTYLNGYDREVTDFKGNKTVYTYAANGQLQQMVEASGQVEQRTTNYTWDTTPGTNRLTRVVVVGDHQVDYTYDPATQRLASVSQTNLTSNGVQNQVRTTTYTYTNNTANGMLQKMVVDGPVSGASDKLTSTYSNAGDLTSVKNNAGQGTTYSNYNQLGEPGQVVGANGDTAITTYDSWGLVTDVQTSPNGTAAHTGYTYDKTGQLTSVTAPDGTVEHYVYDDTRRLIAKYRAANGLIAGGAGLEEEDYIYNAIGEVIEVDETARTGSWGYGCVDKENDGDTGPICIAWGYKFSGTSAITSKVTGTYDGLGRVWKEIGNNGQIYTTGYDLNGNLTSTNDALGHLTTYSYDHLNRKIGTVDAKSGITVIGYDAGNRVTSVWDPRTLATSYVYDGFGQLWKQISPDTGTTTFAWDAGGRKTGFTRADGTQTAYTFDGLNRIATVTAGGQTQTFTYDSCTNGVGRLCSESITAGSYTHSQTTTYTPEGWVSGQSSIFGGKTYNTAYAQDNMGRVTGVTYQNGVVANYVYSNGKLAAVTATINGTTKNIATGLTYQPYAGVAGWTYGNGLVRGYNYDMDGRLTGISTTNPSPNTVLQSLTLGYNTDDSVHAITNGSNGSLTQSFGYDELTRLTGVTSPSGNSSWGYDADSNRSSQTVAAGSTTYNMSSGSNELANMTGAGARTFGYDANGNRTSDSGTSGAITFHYDPFNRMDSSTKGGVTTTYHVDPDGYRVFKQTGTNWAHFVYGMDGSLLTENNATAQTDYVWMGGALVGVVRGGTLYTVHTDQVGRPEIVTNGAKTVVWRASNFAFDRTVTLDSIGGLNIGFPGQYYDAESGLWNNGFRDYDATTGRYIESDPLGLAAGINTFAYCLDDPIGSVDSLGTKTTVKDVFGWAGFTATGLRTAPWWGIGTEASVGFVYVGGVLGSLTFAAGVGAAGGTIIYNYAGDGTGWQSDLGHLEFNLLQPGTYFYNAPPSPTFEKQPNPNTLGDVDENGNFIGADGTIYFPDGGKETIDGIYTDSKGNVTKVKDLGPVTAKGTQVTAQTLPTVTAHIPFEGDYILLNGGSAFYGLVSYSDLMAAYPSPALNDGRYRSQ